MITDEYFENLYSGLQGQTEAFSLTTLNKIRDIAIELSNDGIINLDREQRLILEDWSNWNANARDWVDTNLPKSYRKGIQIVDARLESQLNAGQFSNTPMFSASFEGVVSEGARELLSDIPEHWTMYGAFQQSAYDAFDNTRVPVLRSVMDTIRDLTVLASDNAYINSDTLTRRELSEEIVRSLADGGITGVRYSDGRTMQLDSYAELVARTQTGNAARQASINRMQERGHDLTLISQHYPTSPMCAPYQGRVFSINGTDEQYPSLRTAISGGLYHVNCKHFQSPYTRGQPIPEAREKVDAKTNREQYKAQNVQRYNERQIRSWKRREASAVTQESRQKAKQKVREWQARQRQHLDANDFLRRKYDREQI